MFEAIATVNHQKLLISPFLNVEICGCHALKSRQSLDRMACRLVYHNPEDRREEQKSHVVRGCEKGAADCIFTVLGHNSLCGYIHLLECLVELIFPSH